MVKNLFHKKRNTSCYLIVEVTFAFFGTSVQKMQLSQPVGFLPYIQVSIFLYLVQYGKANQEENPTLNHGKELWALGCVLCVWVLLVCFKNKSRAFILNRQGYQAAANIHPKNQQVLEKFAFPSFSACISHLNMLPLCGSRYTGLKGSC